MWLLAYALSSKLIKDHISIRQTLRAPHAGLMLDTQDLSAVLMKKFELAFGFAQGERWYGTVVCDEHEGSERARSGAFHGELVLISKRALPRRKVRVNSESQELTLLDLNGGGSDLSITIPYKARQKVAHQVS